MIYYYYYSKIAFYTDDDLLQEAPLRTIVKVNFSLALPLFSNLETKVIFECITTIRGQPEQFGSIHSFKVVSAGRNVDGVMSEVISNRINPVFSTRSPGGFYADSAELDLGIVTNTGI